MQLTAQSRKAYVQYNELLAHIDATRHREAQCRRGYRDEDGNWIGGLYAFVKYFWHILEPETPFVPGWSMEAICQHLEAVTFGEIHNLLINVPPGFCKSLDCNTAVLTTSGWKKHGDLDVGDYVYGPDGLPKRIIARTQNKIEQCYEVKFDDGASVVAGSGHLWEVERDFPNQNEGKRGQWKRRKCVVQTPDLKPGNKTASRRCADRIRLTQPLQTPERLLPIDPYLLGAWLGDGSSSAGVLYCGNTDLDHFSAFGHIVAGTQTAHRVSVECLTSRLRGLGLLKNKHIPDDYLTASEWQRWGMLQGLMDTDGQANEDGLCRFTTGNERLADDFITLASSLGLKPRLGKPFFTKNTTAKKRGPYFRIRFTPTPGAKIFRLARKQSRLTGEWKRGIGHRYVAEIIKTTQRLVNCIQVEGDLYLVTDRFVLTHNSLLVNVYWPAWEWACCSKSHLRYVTFSYSASLTERDNRRFGDLVTSKEFRDLYGKAVKIVKKGDTLVTNTRKGWKLASSVGGVGTGERGDRIILDDPHNVKEAESDVVRSETVRWFRESMSNRLNDMDRGAIVIIMQRVHEDDVSGLILSLGLEYCHLMIPMEFDISRALDDAGRPLETEIGWIDPRLDVDDLDGCDGSPAWLERFPVRVIEKTKKEVGPYAWAGQYQQSPAPRGGGIFKTNWWQVWEAADGKFPIFDLVVASVDSAFTANEMNDPTGLTVWGVFHIEGKRRLMLVHAWRKHLEFSGVRTPYETGESKSQWIRRTQPTWGLLEWIKHTCERFKVDKLLIEGKGSGLSAIQELRNRYGMQDWATQACPVKGDKVARATAVQAVFANLGIYAPVRDWSDMVITEMSVFPNGKYDDLTDSATQAIKWLRDNGFAPTDEEVLYAEEDRIKLKPKEKSLYPI